MKLLTAASLGILSLGATLAEDSCAKGRWGPNCNAVTGACELGCSSGWSGVKCDVASCPEDTCEDRGGHCVAPNVCACPSSEVNTVASVSISKSGEYSVTCDNLKISGSRGAGVGFLILTASIAACGIVERQINKGKVVGGARWKQAD